MNKSQLFRALAKRFGACDKVLANWTGRENDEALLNMAEENLSFITEKDFPGIEFLRETFDEEELHKRNFYIDETVDISVDRTKSPATYTFFGNTTGAIDVSGYAVVFVNVMHNSDITVRCYNRAIVFIRAFGDTNITLKQKGDSAVTFSLFSVNAKYHVEGRKIKIKRHFNEKLVSPSHDEDTSGK